MNLWIWLFALGVALLAYGTLNYRAHKRFAEQMLQDMRREIRHERA